MMALLFFTIECRLFLSRNFELFDSTTVLVKRGDHFNASDKWSENHIVPSVAFGVLVNFR